MASVVLTPAPVPPGPAVHFPGKVGSPGEGGEVGSGGRGRLGGPCSWVEGD